MSNYWEQRVTADASLAALIVVDCTPAIDRIEREMEQQEGEGPDALQWWLRLPKWRRRDALRPHESRGWQPR